MTSIKYRATKKYNDQDRQRLGITIEISASTYIANSVSKAVFGLLCSDTKLFDNQDCFVYAEGYDDEGVLQSTLLLGRAYRTGEYPDYDISYTFHGHNVPNRFSIVDGGGVFSIE